MLVVIGGRSQKNSSFVASNFSMRKKARLLLRQKSWSKRGFEESDKDIDRQQNRAKT